MARASDLAVRAGEGVVAKPWREVPKVVRATAAILRTHRSASTTNTDSAIAMGSEIATIRATLEPGEFEAWAREAVPFTSRTARNYIALADFAAREPNELRRLAHLGPSKLYRLTALPPTRRRKLDLTTPIPIPGTDEEKPIETMTVPELARVVGGLITPPVPKRPIKKLLQSYTYRLAGLDALTDQLIARAREVPPGEASELIAELHGLTESLEAAFAR